MVSVLFWHPVGVKCHVVLQLFEAEKWKQISQWHSWKCRAFVVNIQESLWGLAQNQQRIAPFRTHVSKSSHIICLHSICTCFPIHRTRKQHRSSLMHVERKCHDNFQSITSSTRMESSKKKMGSLTHPNNSISHLFIYVFFFMK